MTLPKAPKKNPRPVSVTVRLSVSASDQLKVLAESHDLSQADVIEHLIKTEYRKWQKKSEN